MGEKYFKNHVLFENVVHIEDPLGVFATLIIGQDKALLFDTAYGIGNLREHVEDLTKLPLIVVNSHGHVDHLCGNYHFDEVCVSGIRSPFLSFATLGFTSVGGNRAMYFSPRRLV